jgi:hypothetical protein
VARQVDAVVWTALPSNFDAEVHKPFSIAEAVRHLSGLTPVAKVKAAEYIWRAPDFVRTPLRTALERSPWFVERTSEEPGLESKPLTPFRHIVGNPQVWQEVARELSAAAKAVGDAEASRRAMERSEQSGPATWRTAMMLFGLAAENMLKAIVAALNPTIGDGGILPRWFAIHDLVKLARIAGLPTAQGQDHFLRRLQAFIECGKYPVGLREGHGRVTWVSLEPGDTRDALNLLEYLEEHLERVSGARHQNAERSKDPSS